MKRKYCNMETNFNFNSAVCTSIEQSRKLLSLGLKKETADMVYTPYYVDGVLIDYFKPQVLHGSMREYIIQNDEDFRDYIPAWSLDRLLCMIPGAIKHNKDLSTFSEYFDLEMYKNGLAYTYDDYDFERVIVFGSNDGLFNAVVDAIEWLIKERYFNKEYLQEWRCRGLLVTLPL